MLRTATGLLAAVALAVAGCGGSDDKGPDALTKPEYVKQADAICKVASGKVTTVAQVVFTKAQPSAAEIRSFADKTFLPVFERELKDLRALVPPKGDEATTTAIYDAVQTGLDKADKDPALLGVSDSTGPFADANAKANAYGLTVCGAS